jgi:uncharacterized alpha-E superfamily protein
MTARMLLARMPAAPVELGWQMLLQACGAYESFARTRSWAGGGSRHVAEFLVLDRLFPRSVLHALATAEECLVALDPATAGDAMGSVAQIRRMRSGLEGTDAEALPGQLADVLGAVQQACLDVSVAITERYFTYALQAPWKKRP